ncbi:hypothetical protein QR98_0086900 [Sarcoptes scabiei]|uniref:Uncharacterized protein n=1 Tax=Sarcoptes scabiei TaxID=52283 RepID=A0A132AI63_SARSC|nr:hypothetical protein QR98_0086900 [Sarcoptes scabiei]
MTWSSSGVPGVRVGHAVGGGHAGFVDQEHVACRDVHGQLGGPVGPGVAGVAGGLPGVGE